MTVFTWVLLIVTMAGTVLNARQDRRCFYIWMVTNSSWALVDFYQGMYAQGCMFVLNLLLSIWGLCRWKRK